MSTASAESRGGQRPAKVGKSGRNKPRARLVCSNCRSRKVKCDAEKLATGQKCSHCRESELQCIFDQVDRRRRGRPSQQSTATLQDRIKFLESALKESAQAGSRVEINEQVPESTDISFRNDNGVRNDSSPLGVSPIAAPETPRESFSLANERRLSFIESVPHMITDDGSKSQALPDNSGLCHTQSRNSLLLADPEISHRGLDSNENAGVAGNLAQDNQSAKDLTYYGPTTQPHIQSPSDEVVGDRGEDDIVPSMPLNMDSFPLRKTLLNLYFKLQHRFQILINESLFMADWSLQKRSQYYSSFLEDAILAFSTRHSTSSAVRKLGEKYAARCKTHIAMELDDPKIGSLQGLLLLGDFEATRGRARIGWTYCVIASGLMVDLGIHVDCSHLVKQGKLTAVEANARQLLLLSTFVYAAQWSLYLGRPNPMSQITLRAVHQAKSESSSVWVGFCIRMLDIMDILNGPASLSGFTRETSDRLLELNSELRSFVDSVQPHLSASNFELEELDEEFYSFYMQFCGLQILLHRAILKSDQNSRELERTNTPQLLSDTLREQLYECVYDNAIRIAQLIVSYQRIFGVDEIVTVMIDNIFVASVALISHIHRLNQQGKTSDQAFNWLQFLSNTLQAMGKYLPATSRMLSCLARIVEDSTLSSIFPPVPDSLYSGMAQNSFDMFCAQGESMGFPGPSAMDLLADGNPVDYLHLTNMDYTGRVHVGSAWNMTPAIFDPMEQLC